MRMPAVFFGVLPLSLSPATDDPIVWILWMMAISGVLMLGCIGYWLIGKLRQKREEDKQK